jgi:transposase-like protein
MTRKHQSATNSNNFGTVSSSYTCDNCNKTYQDRTGLWRHKKKCSVAIVEPTTIALHDVGTVPTEIDKDLLVKMLLKNQDIMENVILKNQDVMEKMMEIMPSMGSNNHSNNTTTNSHNTQNFNIQMFLNEHCKNAMNLKDFIESLPITAETYDNTIENGLTKTITNMITNGLNQLDVLERPIHCTDASRKTIYVKEEDIWEKDNELLKVLVGIKNLAYKQRTMINKWKDMNVGWDKDESIQLKLTNLICNSMTDIENDEKETSKIIRAIGKNTYLTGEIKNVYT